MPGGFLRRTERLRTIIRQTRQQRVMSGLTIVKLSAMSGVSRSHLSRIERGERFPSAQILFKIGNALGFKNKELLMSAGYLNNQSYTNDKGDASGHPGKNLDPYVAAVLSLEPLETQRAVLAISTALKYIAKSIAQDNSKSSIRGTEETNLGTESLK